MSVLTGRRLIADVLPYSGYGVQTAGEYKSSECFSKRPPDGFSDKEARRGKVGAEGLADTKTYLGSDI